MEVVCRLGHFWSHRLVPPTTDPQATDMPKRVKVCGLVSRWEHRAVWIDGLSVRVDGLKVSKVVDSHNRHLTPNQGRKGGRATGRQITWPQRPYLPGQSTPLFLDRYLFRPPRARLQYARFTKVPRPPQPNWFPVLHMQEGANEEWETVRTLRTPGTRAKLLIRASMVLSCALSEARTNIAYFAWW